jgi:hypothetical protein
LAPFVVGEVATGEVASALLPRVGVDVPENDLAFPIPGCECATVGRVRNEADGSVAGVERIADRLA